MQPLFYRDPQGNMHYPLVVDGWYWGPEAQLVWNDPTCTIEESWVFEPTTTHKPFAWVEQVYEKRRKLKEAGNPAELALKLAINSLYGKLAQRVGWDVKTKEPPKWHQLEWAGWLTSYTRSLLFLAATEADRLDALIATETDAVFTTKPIQVDMGNKWGQWKPIRFQGITYLQNGVYFIKKNEIWEPKYRGLDRNSIDHDRIMQYLASPGTLGCKACAQDRYMRKNGKRKRFQREREHTCEYIAVTRRFRGFGMALNRKEGLSLWRAWETEPRAIVPVGPGTGKRIHDIEHCRACTKGMTYSDGLHDTIVARPQGGDSVAHNLPWLTGELSKDQELTDEEKLWETIYNEESYNDFELPAYVTDGFKDPGD
jgi:hypothetical protein